MNQGRIAVMHQSPYGACSFQQFSCLAVAHYAPLFCSANGYSRSQTIVLISDHSSIETATKLRGVRQTDECARLGKRLVNSNKGQIPITTGILNTI